MVSPAALVTLKSSVTLANPNCATTDGLTVTSTSSTSVSSPSVTVISIVKFPEDCGVKKNTFPKGDSTPVQGWGLVNPSASSVYWTGAGPSPDVATDMVTTLSSHT